jgi:hypothetical protein
MNYNKSTRKAVKVEPVTVLPRPIVITNNNDKGTLISAGNLTSSESAKAYDFFKFNGKNLPVGKDFGSFLKESLGDIHYEKVGVTASIRLSQEKRIEFTQNDVAAIISGNPMQLAIYVTNVGSPTYSH